MVNLIDLQNMPGAGARTIADIAPVQDGVPSVSDVRKMADGRYVIDIWNGSYSKWCVIDEDYNLVDIHYTEVEWPEPDEDIWARLDEPLVEEPAPPVGNDNVPIAINLIDYLAGKR